jgi:predicted N-acyltransferase
MSRTALEVQVRVANRLQDIPAARWDSLANPAASGDASAATHNPFVSHAFLSALEDSGCVGGRSGWQPVHILVEASAGEVVAAAPCYVKSHSQGEYVFDHGWADAYMRAGGRYYPKLQVSVPFTPVTGPRLLVSPQADRDTARAALVAGLRALR